MSDETQKTVGTGDTVTPSDQGTAQSPPPAGSDSTALSGYEQRIHGLTAEKKRAMDEAESWKQKYADLEAQHKSEEEKRLDAIRAETREQVLKDEVEPFKQRATEAEAALESHLAVKMAQIPEDKRDLVPDKLPIHERFIQADRVLAALGSGKGAANVGGGMNPGTKEPEIISGSEYNRWAALDQYNEDQRKEFDANKERMQAAIKERRVDFSR